MKSNDLMKRDEIRQKMQDALKNNDADGYLQAFDKMIETIGEDIEQRYVEQIEQLKSESDSKVLTARGVRQLTSAERQYYQRLSEAFKAEDVKQALANSNLIMPTTVLDAVFDELQTAHPLLSRIEFIPSGGVVKMLMNTNGYNVAQWGPLCEEIIKEVLSGFKEVDTSLLKLSAFIPVCKATLELGPEWLDDYVRQVLYEALANGLEVGIVAGDGNGEPIGMTRQVGDGVAVVNGAYPEKEQIVVNDFSAETIGSLLSYIAVDENGKPRTVRDLILIVNPQDYFSKVMPATTLLAPDGTYRNDVMPYPMTIVQSMALEPGQAVLGMAYKYFAVAGMGREGRIEYSDHYQFLEDDRVYLIKLYSNGFPMDNNAFLHLNIENLRPATYKVTTVTAPTASSTATLGELKIGALTLTPAFAAATDTYTATTSNATNTVTARATDAAADVEILVNGEEIANGTAAVWVDGSNTVAITVTAENGTTTEVYTITVTADLD